MDIINTATLIAATACSTFGAVYLGIWFRQRGRRDYLVFALCAFSVAVFSVFELAGMHAVSPAEYGMLVRWAHLPGWGMIVLLPWFVHLYLQAGRPWLLWSLTILRTVVVVLNFILQPNINFSQVTGIRQVSFFGTPVSIAETVPSRWMFFAQFTLLLAVVFCADAAITVWRRGNRRRALAVGGTTTFFLVVDMVMAVLILWGFIPWPFTLSVFFTAIIVAMAFELSSDLLRSVRLALTLDEREAELRETEQRLGLSVSAANVGIWTHSIGEKTMWASDEWRQLFDFKPSKSITFANFLQRVHPDDRDSVRNVLKTAVDGGEEYETEHRILLRNGDVRWIGSRGKVQFNDGEPKFIRGATVDITKRKLAEKAARDLSGKLIDAQETERARLARELHDDLSQSLALLSIRLEALGRESVEPDSVKKQVGELTSQIQQLSSDVHRMSHELHPAKLGQLGLESALRGFCREIATTHGFTVDFAAANIPRLLPNDISLCLYRVTQESLQNVAKHSGASFADVSISMENDEISLVISDNGCGFDPQSPKAMESLGLTSMRERMRLVNGSLSIESHLGGGTRIRVNVPLHS